MNNVWLLAVLLGGAYLMSHSGNESHAMGDEPMDDMEDEEEDGEESSEDRIKAMFSDEEEE